MIAVVVLRLLGLVQRVHSAIFPNKFINGKESIL